MRAISLWQPMATGMALGLKTIETRGRQTHIRGDLAIHASLRAFNIDELPSLLRDSLWRERERVKGYHSNIHDLCCNLPIGVVVAVVDLWECWPVEHIANLRHPPTLTEMAWGNYSAGRFGWATRNLRPLKEPVTCIGRQGFFWLPEAVEAKVRAQL